MSLHKYLAAFEAQAPWGVFSWRDSETAAKGWVVIHSLRGGAAGGGMRMRKGLTCAELLSLSKIMEIKFKVTGPAMGGAKSGIDFDPHDPRKAEVLGRWFKAVKPFLSHYYGTAGDLNISESTEVRPMMAAEGLLHPQIGILRGHYKDEGTKTRLEALRYGTSLLLTHPQLWVSGKESMSDMITGYGVAMSVRHFYDLWGGVLGEKIAGKRVLIQGWGNVSSSAALYLARAGALIVGVMDAHGGIIVPQGMGEKEVEDLFLRRKDNCLNPKEPSYMPYEEVNELFWETSADIFIPGAASRLLTTSHMKTLIEKAGVCVVSCGANIPFDEKETFYGKTTEWVDKRIALIPDFIANCGIARAFSFLMSSALEDKNPSDIRIFEDASQTIYRQLHAIRANTKQGKCLTEQVFLHLLGKNAP